jgi:hypothetical protein
MEEVDWSIWKATLKSFIIEWVIYTKAIHFKL